MQRASEGRATGLLAVVALAEDKCCCIDMRLDKQAVRGRSFRAGEPKQTDNLPCTARAGVGSSGVLHEYTPSLVTHVFHMKAASTPVDFVFRTQGDADWAAPSNRACVEFLGRRLQPDVEMQFHVFEGGGDDGMINGLNAGQVWETDIPCCNQRGAGASVWTRSCGRGSSTGIGDGDTGRAVSPGVMMPKPVQHSFDAPSATRRALGCDRCSFPSCGGITVATLCACGVRAPASAVASRLCRDNMVAGGGTGLSVPGNRHRISSLPQVEPSPVRTAVAYLLSSAAVAGALAFGFIYWWSDTALPRRTTLSTGGQRRNGGTWACLAPFDAPSPRVRTPD